MWSNAVSSWPRGLFETSSVYMYVWPVWKSVVPDPVRWSPASNLGDSSSLDAWFPSSETNLSYAANLSDAEMLSACKDDSADSWPGGKASLTVLECQSGGMPADVSYGSYRSDLQ